jgi:hypothetical protein
MTLYRHRVSGPGAAGDVWVSTLHSVGIASLVDAHEAFRQFVITAIGTTLKTFWPTTTKATQIMTDQLDEFTWKNVAQLTDVHNEIGTSVGKAVSQRDCLVVGLRTPLPTRAGRGRMFLPSPSADHYTNVGEFISAELDTLASDFGSALATMRGTIQPVIAHRNTKTTTPITRVTIGNVPGIQRRRTNKVTQTYSGNSF